MSADAGFVQTVLGAVDPSDLGLTLTHEHVFQDLTCGCQDVDQYETVQPKYVPMMKKIEAGWEPKESGPGTAATWRAKWEAPISLDNLADRQRHWVYYADQKLTSLEDAIYELNQFHRVGGGTVVDQTTRGMGRDPVALVEASRASGVHIVMGTSWYINSYHPPDMDQLSEDQLVDLIVKDIEVGVGGGIRAGIIGEVGMEFPMHPNEEKALRASARASTLTGIPLSVHPGTNPQSPFDIVQIVEDAGGDLNRTIMAHCDTRLNTSAGTNVFDPKLHLDLAKTGVYLSYDTFGWEASYRQRVPVDQPNDAIRLNWIKAVADAGHSDQLLVSCDMALKHWQRQYGGHGWRHMPETIAQLMRYKGFDEELVQKIFVENAARILTKV